MKNLGNQIVRTTLLGLAMLGITRSNADAGFTVSFEAAKVQSTSVSGATTDTFDSYPAGVYKNVNYTTSVGTYTSPGIAAVAANAYGGAGGTGNYIAIGAESGTTSATLSFSAAESYFGFWWSAADTNNSVAFYSKGKLIGTLATANLLSDLGSAYYGNPNNGQDSGEKFAYVNFYGTSGTTFDQVIFSNASLSTGFELDNISVASSFTQTTGTVVTNAMVPEPSSLTLLGLSGLLGGGAWVRQRRQVGS